MRNWSGYGFWGQVLVAVSGDTCYMNIPIVFFPFARGSLHLSMSLSRFVRWFAKKSANAHGRDPSGFSHAGCVWLRRSDPSAPSSYLRNLSALCDYQYLHCRRHRAHENVSAARSRGSVICVTLFGEAHVDVEFSVQRGLQ